ncbi:hypothetical protein [Yersinia intermedia]|uniref:hypothetical protein n=1 Tax=Yersinia intermedia TaxID=631 RepID=UPI00119F9866|nr:hypothetical protein [Yersinia intermedia]
MPEIYDLESVYDEKISPLMKQIIDICNENQMPMICSFAFENCEERNIGTCTTILNGFDNRFIPEFGKALKIIRKEPDVLGFAIRTMRGNN